MARNNCRTGIASLLPTAANWPPMERWWGFRPCTPDEGPLLGPGPLQGLWLACGHHRKRPDGSSASPQLSGSLARRSDTSERNKPMSPHRPRTKGCPQHCEHRPEREAAEPKLCIGIPQSRSTGAERQPRSRDTFRFSRRLDKLLHRDRTQTRMQLRSIGTARLEIRHEWRHEELNTAQKTLSPKARTA